METLLELAGDTDRRVCEQMDKIHSHEDRCSKEMGSEFESDFVLPGVSRWSDPGSALSSDPQAEKVIRVVGSGSLGRDEVLCKSCI